MTDLEWIPDIVPPNGAFAAQQFTKLLGSPSDDPLTVMVRETAQNSWDARINDLTTVDFHLSGFSLSPTQMGILRDRVFADGLDSTNNGLREFVIGEDHEPLALCITDRHTTGLTGRFKDAGKPDIRDDTKGKSGWVSFVLMMGDTDKGDHSGGTYGFGKTITYIVSKVQTIIIYSRPMGPDGPEESRLIVSSIGEGGIVSSIGEGGIVRRTYGTGRHWWGRNEEGAAVPLLGTEADELAMSLGMPGFDCGETGTSVMILGPDLGGRNTDQVVDFLVDSVLWHLWPKLVVREGFAPMNVSVGWDSEPVPVPDPAERPHLKGFVAAYRELIGESAAVPPSLALGIESETIVTKSPKSETGKLVSLPLVIENGPYLSTDADEDLPAASPIKGPSHHVALLRTPELVVTYLEGVESIIPSNEWVAVFRCRDELDGVFAGSEPPSHDMWDGSLHPSRSREQKIVNGTLRGIRDAMQRRFGPKPVEPSGPPSSAVTVANFLGDLVFSQPGRGPGRARRHPGTTRSGGRGGSLSVEWEKPFMLEGAPASQFGLVVAPAKGSSTCHVRISVWVALDGKKPRDKQDRQDVIDPDLAIAGIRGADRVVDEGRLTAVVEIAGAEPRELEVDVRRSTGTSILLEADLVNLEESLS